MLIQLKDAQNNANGIYGFIVGEDALHSNAEVANAASLSLLVSNGGILIGNTQTGGFDAAYFSQGPGLNIAFGAGSITIDATPAFDHANAAFAKANSVSANVLALVTDNVPETTTNLYFTAARVRANVSNTAPINYNTSTGTFSHADSGVVAATYGTQNTIPVLVVNAFGHLTSVVNTAVAIDASQVTSGTLAVARGGTGQTAASIVNGALLIGNTVSGGYDVNTLIAGSGILISNGAGSITITANGAAAMDQFARDTANGAYAHANGAFSHANGSFSHANGAFSHANGAFAHANGAFDKANGAVQTAFVTINVANQSNVVADSNTDTLTLVSGNGISITTNSVTDTITFSLSENEVVSWDDFISGGFASSVAVGGKLGWYFNPSGSGSQAPVTEPGYPGIVRLRTGATAGSRASMFIPGTTTNPKFIQFGDKVNIDFIVKLVDVGTTTKFAMGLSTNLNYGGQYIRIEKDTADTNLFAASANATSTTRVDIGAPVAGTWYRFSIRKEAGNSVNTVFSINGTVVAQIDTSRPAPGSELAATFVLDNHPSTSGSRDLWVDYWRSRTGTIPPIDGLGIR